MLKKTEPTAETNSTAYFINAEGELQQADVGSGLYNEARNFGRLFVISQPSKAGDQVTISIPYIHLEAVAQQELPELLKAIQKLSGSEERVGNALYEVTGIAKAKAGKTAEKLLNELAERLKIQKTHRILKQAE